MTLPTPDTERGYAKPVEQVAKAIVAERMGKGLFVEAGGDPRAFDEAVNANWLGQSEVDVRQRAAYVADANAAINKLRSLGFISDLGISAIEAERAMK